MTKRRSNAKTAYGLMSDIRAYILEEPKRVYMGEWIIKGHQNIEDKLDVQGPACGTVGCIAGNAVLLANAGTGGDIATRALDLLSGNNFDLEDVLDRLFHATYVDADYGTEKYAQIVAKRIASFQEKYKAELQRVRL